METPPSPDLPASENSQTSTTPGIVNYEKGNQNINNVTASPEVHVNIGGPSGLGAPSEATPSAISIPVTTETTPDVPAPEPLVEAPQPESPSPNNESELKEQVAKLTETVANLTSKIDQLLDQNAQQAEQNAKLIELLTNKAQEPTPQPEPEPKPEDKEPEKPKDEAMERMKELDGDDEPKDEAETTAILEPEESTSPRRSWWRRARDIMTPTGFVAWMQSRWATRGSRGGEERPVENNRRNRLGIAAAALMIGGVAGGVGVELIEHLLEAKGVMPNHGIGRSIREHVDLKGINPNTIHAETPTNFQHGVLHLLSEQGIHAHGVTSEKINHMNHWMAAHNIASGMKGGHHGLEQNLVHFTKHGHEFTNANASADQGFRLGPSGTGREGLDRWVREAERAGITFTRTKS